MKLFLIIDSKFGFAKRLYLSYRLADASKKEDEVIVPIYLFDLDAGIIKMGKEIGYLDGTEQHWRSAEAIKFIAQYLVVHNATKSRTLLFKAILMLLTSEFNLLQFFFSWLIEEYEIAMHKKEKNELP